MDCTIFKGLIFAQKVIYFSCLASLQGSSLNQNINGMCLHHVSCRVDRSKVKSYIELPLWLWKLKEAIFLFWLRRDQLTTLEALLHICIYMYSHINSTETTHTSFMCVGLKRLDLLLHTKNITNI